MPLTTSRVRGIFILSPERCQHPECQLPASRQIGEVVTQGSRRVCVMRKYCAAHVPIGRSVAIKAPLPTHGNSAGQTHVPRVWEVTGKAPLDRVRAVREWKQIRKQKLESIR